MSYLPSNPPECLDANVPDIELVIEPRKRDLGNFIVGRVLPSPRRRMVGPFLFCDEMGPAELTPGTPLDVRPHPHINLATVTYLFDGEIVHRDSLGSEQAITPGAINWMSAGRGIVHSERAHPKSAQRMHGLQLWCGLPSESEETAPTFDHYPAATLPSIDRNGATIRVLAGEAYGLRSPVKTLSRLFYVDIQAREATSLEVPDYPERAAYAVSGELVADGTMYPRGAMLVFSKGKPVTMQLAAGTRMVMLGGEPLDGPRHMFWNFVSSRAERIEQAKQAWKTQSTEAFPKVPGDDQEFIPLPD
ncbi:MAG: pirin family protein [Kofleriaceae bacterium]|nr:pirin family protein [Kofleriaceae bacterium]